MTEHKEKGYRVTFDVVLEVELMAATKEQAEADAQHTVWRLFDDSVIGVGIQTCEAQEDTTVTETR
jgi:hypothetical protein